MFVQIKLEMKQQIFVYFWFLSSSEGETDTLSHKYTHPYIPLSLPINHYKLFLNSQMLHYKN